MKKNKIFFNSPAIVGNEIRNISKLKQFSSVENIQKNVLSG